MNKKNKKNKNKVKASNAPDYNVQLHLLQIELELLAVDEAVVLDWAVDAALPSLG